MRILMINVVCGIRSTGRICTDLATALEKQGHEVKIAYGREEVPEEFRKYAVRIGNDADVYRHVTMARLFDASGFGSRNATVRFISWVKEYDPDIIHLHNIHGYYINIEILFEYLKTCNKRIIWTLHDCWPFTGHAAYCEAAGCERWKDGCHYCANVHEYPKSISDRSSKNWNSKKSIFMNVPDLTIITPSMWLAELVKKSFLSMYPVAVIHNGIDTSVFHRTSSSIKCELGIENKKMILGVAALWDSRKGLKDFAELKTLLPSDYQIVLVGVSEKQRRALPSDMISLARTNSAVELAELYSAAYVYVNPTYEDNYPTTNLEAIACGTPVITYKTGGSPESASLYGISLPKGMVAGIANSIEYADRLDRPDEKTIAALDAVRMVNEYLNFYQNNQLMTEGDLR